jgi:hypothetical protein
MDVGPFIEQTRGVVPPRGVVLRGVGARPSSPFCLASICRVRSCMPYSAAAVDLAARTCF